MPEYRLDHYEGGEVTLASGQWRWFPIRLLSLPEEQCEMQLLILAHNEHPGDLMRVRVPPEVDGMDLEAITELARNPEEREFFSEDHHFNIRPLSEGTDGNMWRVRPSDRPAFQTDLHNEKALGDLSQEELGEIARIR